MVSMVEARISMRNNNSNNNTRMQTFPRIKINKIKTNIIVPQKALSKIFERVANAKNTFLVPPQKNYNHILIIDDAVGSGSTINEIAGKVKEKKIANIKAKVLTIARFNRMLKNAKENQEILTKAKKFSADGKLPQGTLLKTVDEIKSDVGQFLALRKIDSDNEKFPIQAYKRRESMKDVYKKK